MKLAISNIAWDERQSSKVYEKMKELKFSGLEIAPSKIFGATPYEYRREAVQFRENISENYGLSICSMQSIWFGRTEMIFKNLEERRVLLDYTKKAIDYAQTIGCKNLVFGCPKNRVINSGFDKKIAIDFFSKLGEYAKQHNTVLALEANPDIYGTNFINYTEEAFGLVKEINNEGFKVNYDFGTVLYNGESLESLQDNIAFINHVHISEPYLKAVSFNEKHKELLGILKKGNYDGFISVEMKLQPLEYVMECLENFRQVVDEINAIE